MLSTTVRHRTILGGGNQSQSRRNLSFFQDRRSVHPRSTQGRKQQQQQQMNHCTVKSTAHHTLTKTRHTNLQETTEPHNKNCQFIICTTCPWGRPVRALRYA